MHAGLPLCMHALLALVVSISPRSLALSPVAVVVVDEDGMEKGVDSYKGGGVGEVRRINVVYFLSRGGRTDHPHLFRVSHLHRAGVRLRDVKRWLSELRGKGMPENFSWSYKRKYKAGYVWQDLMDDDLITPISDNEYVLKGCDVRGTPPPCADAPKDKSSSLDEKKQTAQEEKTPCNQKQVEEVLQATADSDESSPKPRPPIDQDSPGGEGESARCRIPFRVDLSQDLQEQKQQQQQEVVNKTVTKAVVARAAAAEQVQGAPGSKKQPVGRAPRMRVAQVLHNILTCGAADADDAALRPFLLQRAGAGDDRPRTPVCPGVDGCGLHVSRKVRLGGGGKDKAKRDGGKRDGGDAHKPASLPRCSQCGKEFKPQELHSHMQSCRGFRERMRSSTSTRISVDKNRNSTARPEHTRGKVDHSPEQPSSALLLTES